jgi:glycosyltransferase involved in cell wall biosynthesis
MTGVGRYVSGLAAGLARIDSENNYVLFSSSLKERARSESLPANFHLIDRRLPVRLLNLAWHRLGSPTLDRLTGESIDVTHSPHPLILPSRRGRSIVTIHDLFFFRHPELTAAEIRRDYASLVKEHAARADAVISVSETTALDIVKELSIERDRITVVPNGIDVDDYIARPEMERQVALLHDLPARFLLFVGTLEPRKNLLKLTEAIELLVKRDWEGTLLLAGGGGMDEPKIDAAVERLRMGAQIRKLGYVAPAHLPTIYRRAHLLVNPSRWEGFGLPPLEAMACRVPAVVSDIPAHRDVAAEAAWFVDPDDPSSIADGIERAWNDDDLRKRLVDAGTERVQDFSWEKTARKTLAVYQRLGGDA